MLQIKTSRLLIAIMMLLTASISHAKQWHYAEWLSDITIHSDSTFTVREIQSVIDFESASFLKRNIELEGLDKVTDVKIYNEKGDLLKDSEADIQYNADKVRIKIIPQIKKAKETWTIEYTVHGGIKFRRNDNELRWDIFPSDKQASVDKVEVLVNLPEDIPKKKVEQKLFIKSSSAEIESSDYSVVSGSVLKYWAEDIGSRDNITIVAKLPKGILDHDRWFIIKPYLWFLIPIFAFVIVFSRWWLSKRDPESRIHIIPHSNPPEDISPAASFALTDGKLSSKEIIATLIDLANRGYLKIIEGEKSNALTPYKHYIQKTIDYDDYSDLREYEKLLLRHIFSEKELVALENLKDGLRRNVGRINRTVWNELIKGKYLVKSPRDVKRRYTINGALFIVAGLVAFGLSKNAGLALGLAGIITILFGRRISPVTQKGFEAKWYVLGFKKHLNLEVKSRSANGIEPELFSEYLPYAITFGIEREWSDIFADSHESLPDWYLPSKGKTASSVMEFINDLSSVISGYLLTR